MLNSGILSSVRQPGSERIKSSYFIEPFLRTGGLGAISGSVEKTIDVQGHRVRYLTAGEGPPLVLLHGVGTSSGEWSWMLPDLARNHLVYAIDLPGYDGSYEPPDYAPAYTASFVNSFLDAVGVERAVVVGNSFGGLVALHLALSEPARVSALVLSDSAGLGSVVNPVMAAITLPGGGELARTVAKTRLGAYQRAVRRALLLFARPWQIPLKWLKDQYKLAQLPNFTDATLASIRTVVGPVGQLEVLLDQLPRLQMPTLFVWESRTGWFLTLRRKRRSPSSKTAPSNSSLTAVTYPTSSSPNGAYQLLKSSLASNLTERVSRHLYLPNC